MRELICGEVHESDQLVSVLFDLVAIYHVENNSTSRSEYELSIAVYLNDIYMTLNSLPDVRRNSLGLCKSHL